MSDNMSTLAVLPLPTPIGPADKVRRPAVLQRLAAGRDGLIADAADGADGTFPSSMYSDHLAPGPAFPKSNVDARPASASDLAVRRGVNSTAEGLSKDD
jgi:hypothetical protein